MLCEELSQGPHKYSVNLLEILVEPREGAEFCLDIDKVLDTLHTLMRARVGVFFRKKKKWGNCDVQRLI